MARIQQASEQGKGPNSPGAYFLPNPRQYLVKIYHALFVSLLVSTLEWSPLLTTIFIVFIDILVSVFFIFFNIVLDVIVDLALVVFHIAFVTFVVFIAMIAKLTWFDPANPQAHPEANMPPQPQVNGDTAPLLRSLYGQILE